LEYKEALLSMRVYATP